MVSSASTTKRVFIVAVSRCGGPRVFTLGQVNLHVIELWLAGALFALKSIEEARAFHVFQWLG